MKIIFFGTPSFAAEILKDLLHHQFEVVAVVTNPDRPKGRSGHLQASPVKEVALQSQLPIYQPLKASDPEFISQLESHKADIFVVAAYGHILRPTVLNMPPRGCINVHASLLPRYRGAAPMQRCLMSGERESGITIMQMDAGMDTGDMLYQVAVPIPLEMNLEELERALLEAGKKALRYILENLSTIVPKPQDHLLATHAPKIEPDDGKMDFTKSSIELHNLVRALSPHPGAYFMALLKNEVKRIKVLQSLPIDGKGNPGQILLCEKGKILIACGNGILKILRLQIEGKKAMSAEEFTSGYLNLSLYIN